MSPPPAKRTRLMTTSDEGTDRAELREKFRAIRPDTVFRLRRIPKKYEKKDVPGLLRTVFQQDSDFPVEVGSLARSPYRANEHVATVTLPEAKALLLNIATVGGNGIEWQLEVNLKEEKRFTLHLDIHFQGITPLHECDEGESTADIIAISGLNGHAFGSFKQRGGPFMWLRDALPEDLPSTRVFIYGYDTQLQGSSSFQNLTDLGISLRTALMDLFSKEEEYGRRSLLFIGHSLGGLLIKEAFIHMKDPAYTKILNATYGFLFFGVPNLGMKIESLVPIVGNQPNRSLLETLGRNSALLRRHQDEFRGVLEIKPIRITSFYETKLSYTACKVGDDWKMQGDKDLLVDFASATSGSNNDHPINRDHSDMVKFSGVEDQCYRATLVEIERLNSGRTPSYSDKLACLQSLAFPSQEWHRDGVVSADGTCDWIFAHETFHNWSQSPRKLLWIRGKPGSGKSTMMKYIFQSLDNQSTNKQILATFFFNGRGDGFLTTLLALYRALLNQLMFHSLNHISALALSYAQKMKQKGACDWTVDELHRFFAQAVPAVSTRHDVCILVDALDEAGQDTATKLIAQFEKIMAAADKAGGVLKICFSCRHYPILTLDTGLIITMERQNQKDIEIVVKERTIQFQKEEARALNREILSKAEGVFQWACLVADRASSLRRKRKSFQLILEEIKRIPKELEKLYRSLLLDPGPDEDPDERRQTLNLFQWVCLSYRPLTQKETQHALAIHADMTFKSVREYMQGKHFICDDDDIADVVKDLSKGLAELRQHGHGNVLQPIHQTVREYLLDKGGLKELQGSNLYDPLTTGHYHVFKTCVKYLKLKEIMETDPLELYSSPSKYDSKIYLQPLLSYALHSLPYHLHQAGENEIISGDLLEIFNWPSEYSMINKWSALWEALSSLQNDEVREDLVKSLHITQPNRTINQQLKIMNTWPHRGSGLLHFAAMLGKTAILDLMLTRPTELSVQSEGSLLYTPLRMAVEAKQEPFALKLLSMFPHLIERELVAIPYRVVHAATINGSDAVLSISLQHGIDPNKPMDNQQWRSLLSLAAQYGQMSTCRLLLDQGAEPNLSYDAHGGPLMAAFEYTLRKRCFNEEICDLLISRGARFLQPLDQFAQARYLRKGSLFRCDAEEVHFIKRLLRLSHVTIHAALEQNMARVVLFLYHECGMDINLEDEFGRTPLFIAIQNGNLEMMGKLVHYYQCHLLTAEQWKRLPFDQDVRRRYGEMMKEIVDTSQADGIFRAAKCKTPQHAEGKEMDQRGQRCREAYESWQDSKNLPDADESNTWFDATIIRPIDSIGDEESPRLPLATIVADSPWYSEPSDLSE